jgi:DNA-binding response OmpR family regulator
MLFFRSYLKDLNLTLPLSQARKIARILVVDDDEKSFPYKLPEKEGYNVRYIPQIETLKELEAGEYDIIVLDIYGVSSEELSTTDGLGIIQHLKKYNPAQLIIAYSGQKYDPNQAEFWKLADDYLGKPSPLITCKQKIDDLLKRHFTPMFYWNTLSSILRDEGVSPDRIRKLEAILVKDIRSFGSFGTG